MIVIVIESNMAMLAPVCLLNLVNDITRICLVDYNNEKHSGQSERFDVS